MIKVYPVILTKTEDGYIVNIPDFDIDTQGRDMAEAIYMARDAIGLMGIDRDDDGMEIPEPNTVDYVLNKDDIVTYVDVDYIINTALNELGMVVAGKDQVTFYDNTPSEYMNQLNDIPED